MRDEPFICFVLFCFVLERRHPIEIEQLMRSREDDVQTGVTAAHIPMLEYISIVDPFIHNVKQASSINGITEINAQTTSRFTLEWIDTHSTSQ